MAGGSGRVNHQSVDVVVEQSPSARAARVNFNAVDIVIEQNHVLHEARVNFNAVDVVISNHRYIPPPLRQRQRDDGLAGGTARVAWSAQNTPSSRQYSLRASNFGTYL